MRKVSRRQLARRLVAMLKERPGDRSKILRMSAGYLLANKQAGQAHLLIQDIADELFEADKHLYAELRTAFPASPQTRQEAESLLKKATGAKTVELDQKVFTDIIGGVVLRTPRLEFDGSVKSQLKQIARGTK